MAKCVVSTLVHETCSIVPSNQWKRWPAMAEIKFRNRKMHIVKGFTVFDSSGWIFSECEAIKTKTIVKIIFQLYNNTIVCFDIHLLQINLAKFLWTHRDEAASMRPTRPTEHQVLCIYIIALSLVFGSLTPVTSLATLLLLLVYFVQFELPFF